MEQQRRPEPRRETLSLTVILLGAATAFAAVASCDSTPPETLVRLHVTADELGFRIRSVSVLQRVGGPGAAPAQAEHLLPVGFGGHAFPLVLAVAPRDASEEWVEFKVDGLGFAGQLLATERAWVAFETGRGLDVEVRLERACGLDLMECPHGEQCVEGGCVALELPPGMGCGNGSLEPDWGEECDDGNTDPADNCLDDCRTAVCGDGVLHRGVEECDDGNTDPADDCLDDCRTAVCGDGVLHRGVEECDDGNTDPADDCLDDCRTAVCGDGVLHRGVEECDSDPDRDYTTSCGTTGTESCTACAWLRAPPDEACNGRDDDCDDEIDEGFPCVQGARLDCTTSCGTPGTATCSATCELPSAAACVAPPERCNGGDDDCDTVVDEDCACATGWEVMTSGTSESLWSVWGTGANDVFVAGSAGTILRYDGTRWRAMVSGTTEDLRGLWGSTYDDVYVVGERIRHFDGRSWSSSWSPAPYVQLNAIWGSGPTDVWAVGTGGRLLHRDDSIWAIVASPTTVDLMGLGGARAGSAYAVGRAPGLNATILHLSGLRWSTLTWAVAQGLHGVWSVGLGNTYIVGSSGTVLHANSSTITPMTSPTSNTLYGVWGSGTDRILVVGDHGDVYLWSGSAWSRLPAGTTEILHGVWGSGPNNVFAVGTNGLILRRCGSGW